MAHVRKVVAADVEALVAMGAALHAESPRYRTMEYDGDKVRRIVEAMVSGEFGGAFVAEEGGVPVGVTLMVDTERWFGPGVFATDLTMYVKPEHRGDGAFQLLIAAAEEWSRAKGLTDIAMGVSTEVHAQQTVRAYEKLGYRVTGYTLTKVLSDGN